MMAYHRDKLILNNSLLRVLEHFRLAKVDYARNVTKYTEIQRDQDNAILKAYGIDVKEENPIGMERPNNCPRCNEPNDKIARFCWKCGMILDKTLSEKKPKEEAKVIEESVISSTVVKDSTKSIVKSFPPEFKDPILEAVLSDVFNDTLKLQKYREELLKKGIYKERLADYS